MKDVSWAGLEFPSLAGNSPNQPKMHYAVLQNTFVFLLSLGALFFFLLLFSFEALDFEHVTRQRHLVERMSEKSRHVRVTSFFYVLIFSTVEWGEHTMTVYFLHTLQRQLKLTQERLLTSPKKDRASQVSDFTAPMRDILSLEVA